jgi:putative zinc finger protein
MEHDEATRLRAPERYALGELTDTERDQFEEHFFDCPACADEVRISAIFDANARSVFGQRVAPSLIQPGWWQWVRLQPALASSMAGLVFLLTAGVTYEVAVERRLQQEVTELRSAQPYSSFFLRGVTRGQDQVLNLRRDSRFVGLSLDLAPEKKFDRYLAEIRTASQAVVFSIVTARPDLADQPLHLLIPVSSLEKARPYTLIVRGVSDNPLPGAGSEVGRFAFLIDQK